MKSITGVKEPYTFELVIHELHGVPPESGGTSGYYVSWKRGKDNQGQTPRGTASSSGRVKFSKQGDNSFIIPCTLYKKGSTFEPKDLELSAQLVKLEGSKQVVSKLGKTTVNMCDFTKVNEVRLETKVKSFDPTLLFTLSAAPGKGAVPPPVPIGSQKAAGDNKSGESTPKSALKAPTKKLTSANLQSHKQSSDASDTTSATYSDASEPHERASGTVPFEDDGDSILPNESASCVGAYAHRKQKQKLEKEKEGRAQKSEPVLKERLPGSELPGCNEIEFRTTVARLEAIESENIINTLAPSHQNRASRQLLDLRWIAKRTPEDTSEAERAGVEMRLRQIQRMLSHDIQDEVEVLIQDSLHKNEKKKAEAERKARKKERLRQLSRSDVGSHVSNRSSTVQNPQWTPVKGKIEGFSSDDEQSYTSKSSKSNRHSSNKGAPSSPRDGSKRNRLGKKAPDPEEEDTKTCDCAIM